MNEDNDLINLVPTITTPSEDLQTLFVENLKNTNVSITNLNLVTGTITGITLGSISIPSFSVPSCTLSNSNVTSYTSPLTSVSNLSVTNQITGSNLVCSVMTTSTLSVQNSNSLVSTVSGLEITGSLNVPVSTQGSLVVANITRAPTRIYGFTLGSGGQYASAGIWNEFGGLYYDDPPTTLRGSVTYSAGSFTVGRAGKFLVCASLGVADVAGTTTALVGIMVSSSNISNGGTRSAKIYNGSTISISGVVNLIAGDYVSVAIFPTSIDIGFAGTGFGGPIEGSFSITEL
jgi:hypothetical protein